MVCSTVSLALALVLPAFSLALPALRMAPAKCPLEDRNLLDVVLFVETEDDCKQTCQNHPDCVFYRFYEEGPQEAIKARALEEGRGAGNTVENQPAQCFLYSQCTREVRESTEACPLTKENTVNVEAFVSSSEECKMLCSGDTECGYYKYFDAKDDKQPMMCYHLRKCTPRVIQRTECPLEKNNYIDHFLFTQSPEDCEKKCHDIGDCRYYFWYPIDYSPAPLYCYLYRNCLGGADEERVGVVVAGRHPGHYFMGQDTIATDVIYPNTVCRTRANNTDEGLSINRAGAVAEYIGPSRKGGDGAVVLCGGRNNDGQVKDTCLAYTPKTKAWSFHSNLGAAREEAASVVMPRGGDMYLLGGLIDEQQVRSTVRLSDGSWNDGPSLPEVRSRFCAVAIDESTMAILGGEVDGSPTSAEMKTYSISRIEWVNQPDMLVRRKDHACAMVKLGDTDGILVSGGVGENEQLLDSVEFFSIADQTWKEMAPLKMPRTEHGMSVIAGLPTVVGGVSSDEFLASVEVLDNSANDDAPMGLEWRIAAHEMATPRYDFAYAAVPISQALPAKADQINVVNYMCNAGDMHQDSSDVVITT